MEKLERYFAVIIVSFLLIAFNQNVNAQYNEVYYLQDSRNAEALLQLLGTQSDNVTERTLIAISNAGDSSHSESIIRFLETNPSEYLRATSMFTLGQLGGQDALMFS